MNIKTSHGIRTKCPHVLFYWELNISRTQARPHIQEVLPVMFVELLFPFEEKIHILTDHQTVCKPFISPVLNQAKSINLPSGSRVFAIRISPFFARELFESPLSELQQKANDMESFMRHEIYTRIRDIVCRDEPFEKRVRSVDQLFCSLIGTENQQLRCVKYCLEKLHRQDGCSVRQLAQDTGYSSRWIEKLFQEYLGNTPQQVTSIVRFNKLIELFKTNSYSRMIDYALEAGYYDHSHLIRDLKKYVKRPPVSFRNEISSFTKIMNHL